MSPLDVSVADADLPGWVRIWMGWLLAIGLSSLVFATRQAGARWLAAGFVASHALLAGIAAIQGPDEVTVGLVAMSHAMFWTPALLYLAFGANDVDVTSVYGVWSLLATATLGFSLFFDWRDTALYLWG